MLTQADVLNKISNPNYLPSMDDLKAAFPLEESFKSDSLEFRFVDPNFTKFAHENLIFQIYTQEFIQTFANYLSTRIATLQKDFGGKVALLELGAGDGRLTKFLNQSTLLKENNIIATDSKDWEKEKRTLNSNGVLELGYLAALEKFATNPTIVISCWMNLDVNWTQNFRDNASIQEYILIGDVLRTAGYGAGWYLPKNSGFECVKLTRSTDGRRNGIVNGAIGRFDGSPFNPESRTEVYSFRRIK